MIHTVTIYTRVDCPECGERFHDVEIRAGFDDAEEWTNKNYQLNQINKICNFFGSTPGEIGKHYDFPCIGGPIEARYITIQINATPPEWLEIQEIELKEYVCRGNF